MATDVLQAVYNPRLEITSFFIFYFTLNNKMHENVINKLKI